MLLLLLVAVDWVELAVTRRWLAFPLRSAPRRPGESGSVWSALTTLERLSTLARLSLVTGERRLQTGDGKLPSFMLRDGLRLSLRLTAAETGGDG